jgi:hypothetical protein
MSRVTVFDVGQELRLPAAKMASAVLAQVGREAAELWKEQGMRDLDMNRDGEWVRTSYRDTGAEYPVSGRKKWDKTVKVVQPEWDMQTLNTHRIRYAAAFAGSHELGLEKAFNNWTYPAQTGKSLILQAFRACQVLQGPDPSPSSIDDGDLYD